MLLHKFRSLSEDEFSNTKSILTDSTIFFARYEKLNDPFEYSYQWTTHGNLKTKIDFWSKLEYYQNALASVDSDARESLVNEWEESIAPPRGHKIIGADHVGIFCASSIWNNLVLWSHYADHHRGACFVFESDDDEVLSDAKNVQYTKTPGQYNLYDGINRVDVLSRKFTDWSYERELRIFHAPGVYHFRPRALKKIIFGLNTWMPNTSSCTHANELIGIARSENPGVELQRAIRNHGTYSLSLQSI
jgi:hypothetical protein